MARSKDAGVGTRPGGLGTLEAMVHVNIGEGSWGGGWGDSIPGPVAGADYPLRSVAAGEPPPALLRGEVARMLPRLHTMASKLRAQASHERYAALRFELKYLAFMVLVTAPVVAYFS